MMNATMNDNILSAAFYEQPTVTLAQQLLGKYLIRESPEGQTVGKIVETEAYLGSRDPASHAFRGKTARNAVMFGAPGRAYIYFIYGMYYHMNVSAAPEGIGEGVLLRALEPVAGIALMQARRKTDKLHNLCSGPAKLVLAMGVTRDFNGHDLRQPPLYIVEDPRQDVVQVQTATRIGVAQAADLPLRFLVAGSPFISRKPK